jgi:prepilin-type N-terminal cleavage/methylation domain-containing protein
MKRREAGFSFIEILVVMAIISVLATMVVMIVPKVQEKAKQTKSMDNVSSMVKLYLAADIPVRKSWPGMNGKNFVLWLVANGHISKKNKENLGLLFSPGDQWYTLDKVSTKDYEPVTMQALQSEGHDDFKRLTSYAGRRNKERAHTIRPSEQEEGALIICDDDDGPLHHAKGMILGFSNGSARFMEWGELDLGEGPDEDNPEGLLGDSAQNERLKHMSSGN